MCKLNSSEANYKVSTRKEEKIHIQRKYKKQGNYYNNNNNNKITIIPSTQVKVIIKKLKSNIYTSTMITIGNNNNSIQFLYIHTYMLNMISALIRCKDHYKILIRRTVWAPNTSKSLQ
jgi:hypothetical protein